MKLTKCTTLLVLGLALTVAFTGCRKRPAKVTDIPGSKYPPIGDVPPGGTVGEVPTVAHGPGDVIPLSGDKHVGWPENRDILKAETVYFDFDKSEVKSSEKSKIQNVASFLKSDSAAAVRVEGNCDERGTEEYNRALGERRALAVREALVALGIAPDRVDTISYGEDKPVVDGHDEAAWSKNRRADFVVLTPPK